MEYSRDDKIRFGQQVVRETRKTARVDTSFLKQSIRATLDKGVIVFREVFYGAFNENAKLIENAQRIMPKEIEWKVIFVDKQGRETTVEGKTRTGRTIRRKSVSSENVSTNKIKSLIKALQNGQKNDKDGTANKEVDKR
jgi:hypothetical protein